jgi:paraquat-inducible protein A
MEAMQRLRACHCCGLIHRRPHLGPGQTAACARCGAVIERGDRGLAATRTAAAAAGALALFFPAVLLPILEIEQLGHRHASSILAGTIELIAHGNWFVGLIVLVFSVVFPLVKLVLLLELSLMGLLHRRHKARTYRIMEQAGKWSMMDVMLLAFLVMLVKLGSLVEFHFGPAVVAFVLCVAMSMLASLFFDPHAIWEEAGDEPA